MKEKFPSVSDKCAAARAPSGGISQSRDRLKGLPYLPLLLGLSLPLPSALVFQARALHASQVFNIGRPRQIAFPVAAAAAAEGLRPSPPPPN